MLELARVQEIRQLLAEKRLSQRKIATTLGVSRGTVLAIARGPHARETRPMTREEDLEERIGPVERCPTCGGRVIMPCLLCHVRRLQQRQKQRRRLAGASSGRPQPSGLRPAVSGDACSATQSTACPMP